MRGATISAMLRALGVVVLSGVKEAKYGWANHPSTHVVTQRLTKKPNFCVGPPRLENAKMRPVRCVGKLKKGGLITVHRTPYIVIGRHECGPNV